jgi:hypothetical protein
MAIVTFCSISNAFMSIGFANNHSLAYISMSGLALVPNKVTRNDVRHENYVDRSFKAQPKRYDCVPELAIVNGPSHSEQILQSSHEKIRSNSFTGNLKQPLSFKDAAAFEHEVGISRSVLDYGIRLIAVVSFRKTSQEHFYS